MNQQIGSLFHFNVLFPTCYYYVSNMYVMHVYKLHIVYFISLNICLTRLLTLDHRSYKKKGGYFFNYIVHHFVLFESMLF